MNSLHTISLICFVSLFLATPLRSCVLVEDAISILSLIEQAPLTDDYLLRTRNAFVLLAHPSLHMLHKDPQGLMTIFKILTKTNVQAFLDDIRSSCYQFTSALALIPEYNQDMHDLRILSLLLFKFINKTFVEFNLLEAQLEHIRMEMV